VNPVGAVIIGLSRGFWYVSRWPLSNAFCKVDDPVGAVSVHGTCGIWGVISVGLFADGKSNYGGAWNGVNGSVTGLFYGDASQLVAQLVGVATLVGFRVHTQLHLRLRGGLAGWATHFRQIELKALTFRRWARWPIRNSS